ncbi:hypothetical protein VN0480_04700 [Helicobacter pylori]
MILNKIYIEDVFTFLDKLEDKSVDLAIIDPPYNLKIASWDSFKNDEEFLTFSYAWIDKMLPKLKDTGSFYIFNTPFNCALFLAYLHHKKVHFLNFITWVKKDGFANAKKRYNHAQESILFYSMHKKNYTFNADEVRIAYESTERIKHAQSKGILKNDKRWFPNPTNPYIQSNIKYISLTPLAIEFLNVQDLLRKNFCYTQALENLLQGFGAECREVMIELDNHYLDIEEMMFFVTFLNIENFTRSEIIEYVREYRSLSRIQKEKLKELVQDYCNPDHFNGNKLEKRDYHNWKNQAQQIFSLLEQSVFFETNKERLILKTLNGENKQNDKKLKRSIKEKALYFEKHGVKKEKGFELHHIVPLCLARSIEEFDLLDKWENLIYIDAFNHAKISQTQNKHICLYFKNCDVILSKGLKGEQESLYFTYIKNVLYKLDLQNAMLEYNKDLLHSKNG